MRKLLADGYSEDNAQDELYLMQALRAADELEGFRDICRVLGKAAGLFAVPTLMAFAVGDDPDRSMASVLALAEISARTQPGDTFDKWDFFSPAFWRPRWLGSQTQFISYVCCISGLVEKDQHLDGDGIDLIGERLIAEMDVHLFPYESFKELRLCTPDWDAGGDVKRILNDVAGDMLVSAILKNGGIGNSPDSLYEENLLNMRCDFLLTRLNFDIDYGVFRYLLKAADVLNRAG